MCYGHLIVMLIQRLWCPQVVVGLRKIRCVDKTSQWLKNYIDLSLKLYFQPPLQLATSDRLQSRSLCSELWFNKMCVTATASSLCVDPVALAGRFGERLQQMMQRERKQRSQMSQTDGKT